MLQDLHDIKQVGLDRSTVSCYAADVNRVLSCFMEMKIFTAACKSWRSQAKLNVGLIFDVKKSKHKLCHKLVFAHFYIQLLVF